MLRHSYVCIVKVGGSELRYQRCFVIRGDLIVPCSLTKRNTTKLWSRRYSTHLQSLSYSVPPSRSLGIGGALYLNFDTKDLHGLEHVLRCTSFRHCNRIVRLGSSITWLSRYINRSQCKDPNSNLCPHDHAINAQEDAVDKTRLYPTLPLVPPTTPHIHASPV